MDRPSGAVECGGKRSATPLWVTPDAGPSREDKFITETHDFVSYKSLGAQAALLRTARGRFHSILNRAGSRSRGHDSAEGEARRIVHGLGGIGGAKR
jgi:hypothetical protein